MFLQFDQIVEGIGTTSLAGIDETHKQVADLSAILGFIEKRAFAMQDGPQALCRWYLRVLQGRMDRPVSGFAIEMACPKRIELTFFH
jgi:hypothetical protein